MTQGDGRGGGRGDGRRERGAGDGGDGRGEGGAGPPRLTAAAIEAALRALPQGPDVPTEVDDLLALYRDGRAGPGLQAFVVGLLLRSKALRRRLMALAQVGAPEDGGAAGDDG